MPTTDEKFALAWTASSLRRIFVCLNYLPVDISSFVKKVLGRMGIHKGSLKVGPFKLFAAKSSSTSGSI